MSEATDAIQAQLESETDPDKQAAYREALLAATRQEHAEQRAKVEPYFPKNLPSRDERINEAARQVDTFLFDIDSKAAIAKAKRENPATWPRKRTEQKLHSERGWFTVNHWY